MVKTAIAKDSQQGKTTHEGERSPAPTLQQDSASGHHPLLTLQRSVGNRAVRQLIQSSVGNGILQRKCAACEQTAIANETCPACEQEQGTLQRLATSQSNSTEVPPIVHDVLRSPGQSLDSDTREFMESRFNQDFSQVRVHTDTKAAESAQAVNAQAYTVGKNIVFARGQFTPQTNSGQQLLAHELTHTIQQGNIGQQLQTRLAIASSQDKTEQEADASATAVRQSQPFKIRTFAPPQIARKPLKADKTSTQEAAPKDPVVLIRIEYAENKVIFYTESGATYEGTVTTDLAPGRYEVALQKQQRKWVITGPVNSGLRFEVTLNNADPWSLPYAKRIGLEVVGAVEQPSFEMTVDERLAKISQLIQNKWTDDSDEKEIIRLLSETPIEQAQELLKKLTEQTVNGKPYLDALDDVVHGDNNLKLHEALSQLRLKVVDPEKGAQALATAPVLPWHDVMGFFEDNATFSVTRTSTGKIRIEYHGGTRLLNSKDFGQEIKKLPLNLFLGGQEYSPDQVLIIHDYDTNRYVPVVAQQLIGYQHAGIRKFLSDVGTVASLAMPLSAARTAAGKVAVFTIERLLPATLLLIDENRLNLTKWFPKWGPRMLHYADIVKTGLAVYGIARFATSGYQIFQNWKAVRQSRAALEGAASSSEAEKVAIALEKQADDIITQAEKIYESETSVAGAASKAVDEADPAIVVPKASDEAKAVATTPKPADETKAITPATQKGIEPAGTPTTSQAASAPVKKTNIFESITPETEKMLISKPELKKLLEANPRAANALKLCNSNCFPEFATKEQILRLETLLTEAEQYDIPINTRRIKEFLHKQNNINELDQAISLLEQRLGNYKIQLGSPKAAQVKGEFERAGAAGERPDLAPEGTKEIPKQKSQVELSHGAGVEGGQLKASQDGIEVLNWNNPQSHIPDYGRGIDAVGREKSGWVILEWKGESSGLGGDQMTAAWLGRKLAELKHLKDPMADVLLAAAQKGQLTGRVYRTTIESGGKLTTVLDKGKIITYKYADLEKAFNQRLAALKK
jgi:hypothetical protein